RGLAGRAAAARMGRTDDAACSARDAGSPREPAAPIEAAAGATAAHEIAQFRAGFAAYSGATPGTRLSPRAHPHARRARRSDGACSLSRRAACPLPRTSWAIAARSPRVPRVLHGSETTHFLVSTEAWPPRAGLPAQSDICP